MIIKVSSLRNVSFFLQLFIASLALADNLHVHESRTRFWLQQQSGEMTLSVDNLSDGILKARVEIEMLNPRNEVRDRNSSTETLVPGENLLKIPLRLPEKVYEDREGRKDLFWYRFHYRVVADSSSGQAVKPCEGILAFSEITPNTSGIGQKEGSNFLLTRQSTEEANPFCWKSGAPKLLQ